MSEKINESVERAIRVGKQALSGQLMITNLERAHLEQFPPEERLGVIVFVRWSEGRTWKGGLQAKLVAKTAFIEASRIFQEVLSPGERPKVQL